MVDICAQHLLTSYGLRSLAPGEPGYQGHYGGGPRDRDAAYTRARCGAGCSDLLCWRTFACTATARKPCVSWSRWELPCTCTASARLGEIFEGDAPFTPHGCIAQAWTVGEVLRAMREIQNKQRIVKRHGVSARMFAGCS